MVGRASTQDSLQGQSDASLRSSDDSFCLQMQVKSIQAETKLPAPKHLVTNLAYKLKPHQERIKYWKARTDICAEDNIIHLSVYKLIFKDPDCEQLTPSDKVTIRTHTTDKINIVGSCSLFVVHPDTCSFKQITFYVTNHEGSVVLSCEISLRLSLIHPHSNWHQIPDCASLVCSKADHPRKRTSKKSVQGKYIHQCVKDKVPVQDETSKWEYKAKIFTEDDKNSQVNMWPVKPAVCDEKRCQDTKFMLPVQPANKKSSNMQLPKWAVQYKY